MNEYEVKEMQKAYLGIIMGISTMFVLLIGFSICCFYFVRGLEQELSTATANSVKVTYQKEPEVVQEEVLVPTYTQMWSGIASYYSEDGCVGCSPTLTMANGKRFDENAMTLAFNQAPLGTIVRVVNVATGDEMIAEVTDTGGFERLGRIADLSKGLKEAINCNDLCNVEVYR